MSDPATLALLQHAVAVHQAGRLDEAASLYARVLAQNPDDLNAVYLSGVVALQRRDFATAAANIARAVAAKPDHPDLQNNLGEALRGLGRLDDAAGAYRRALALAPDHAGALANLALVARARGALGEAIDGLRRALALEPQRADHLGNLAGALCERGDLGEAEALYRRALALDPANGRATAGLAVVLRDSGRSEAALALIEDALTRRPDDPYLLSARADLHYRAGRFAAAAADCRRTLVLMPDDADCHCILANVAMRRGEADAALASIDRWVASLGAASPRTVALARSARLFLAHYASSFDAEAIWREHRAWVAACAPRVPPSPPVADRDPARRLRIGFVSPDLRGHPVATFAEPVFAGLDRRDFAIILYADLVRPDAVSERLRGYADAWRPIHGRGDDEVAAQVRSDAIDILIDLAGHTADNRMLVFAARPAPVQATWLGYPATTGLVAIDWRISDGVCDPPEDDARSAERVMRLGGFHCFRPPADAPAVAPLPARSAPLTFGSFNNANKISDRCAALFARVLAAVPGSRLVLKSSTGGDGELGPVHIARIAAHGVDAQRITFLPRLADPVAHLAAYGGIDVALDTFPYNGTTTTCEALWMGVPVVTLRGDRHAARVGASLLGQLGLGELIAASDDDFVERAGRLSADVEALARMRVTLRARMAASRLCDEAAFVREFAAALRAMWRDRIASGP